MSCAAGEGTGLRIKTVAGNILYKQSPQMTRGDPIIGGLYVWGKGGGVCNNASP
jgi:hypothetical protein